MRTVSFKSVLNGVLRREGGGNLVDDLALSAQLIEFIADRVRTAWEYYIWPECFVTEFRRFRAEYSAAATYTAPSEVWYDDGAGLAGYFAPVAGDLPTAGQSPATHPAKWQKLATLLPLVAFEQEGKTPFEACTGAWIEDPREVDDAEPVDYAITGEGVLVAPGQALNGVWLRLRTVCPDFAAEIYRAEVGYQLGVPVYFDTLGEIYRCVVVTTAGQTPATHPASWALVSFPMIFARAVKAGALADWQRSDGEGSAVKTRDSEERFTQLLDEQVWQLTQLQGQAGVRNETWR